MWETFLTDDFKHPPLLRDCALPVLCRACVLSRVLPGDLGDEQGAVVEHLVATVQRETLLVCEKREK